MALMMVFWDGVGIGKKDRETNPFLQATLPAFDEILRRQRPTLRESRISTSAASVVPVNATLGVGGLPQSGTGQTALFTGENASRILGQHFGPYPYSTLRPIIKEKNLFTRLQEAGKRCRFANAYPDRYFEYLNARKGRYPVVAFASISAGMPLHDHVSLAAGTSISADFTAERWHEFGHMDVVPITALDAGDRFLRLGREADFILFEYFFTDQAGHSQDMRRAIEVLQRVDMFLQGILAKFDPSRDTLLFISDHGNIEDLTVKSHTRNPVPFISIGRGRTFFADHVRRLTDVTPAILRFVSSS